MEILHSDLVRYAYDGMICHPLVYAPLTKDVSHINQVYLHKKDAVAKAKANRDWSTYVFHHERPYRFPALIAAAKKGLKEKPFEFWALVGRVWRDSENIHQHLKDWKQLWETAIEGRRACMSDEDIRIFDGLPEQIEVWRGTSHKRGLAGLSWTLDREKAVWFGQRFCSESCVALLAKGTVEKDDVLAYLGERDEREIISMKVSIISVTKFSAVPSDSRESVAGGEAVMAAER
jgi:hypothetical protein